jgi:hypothetical protein
MSYITTNRLIRIYVIFVESKSAQTFLINDGQPGWEVKKS